MKRSFVVPCASRRFFNLAMSAMSEPGLHCPAPLDLTRIINCAYGATALFCEAALRKPSDAELDTSFKRFVVQAAQCVPGTSDARAN